MYIFLVVGSIPSQGTFLGCGLIPSRGACKRQLIDASRPRGYFSLSLLSLRISGEDLNKKKCGCILELFSEFRKKNSNPKLLSYTHKHTDIYLVSETGVLYYFGA